MGRRTCRALPCLLLVLVAGCGEEETELAPDPCSQMQAIDATEPPPIHTPIWAFEPWISKDISDADDTYDFVDGFTSRDIPVGVVVLDSPWETNYNSFVPNPERYPDFETMVADLRADDIRVVLWITQMMNVLSYDLETGGDSYAGPAAPYEQGLECGFYIEDAATFGWWKGTGSAVDFFNPAAVAWWHRLQDPLFDLGINGFKCDFGESYVRLDTVDTAVGPMDHQAYSEAYYRDFYAYGAARRGIEEFVTMVRPWDQSYDHEGRFHALPEHAPVGWVGDNRRDWVGLADALDHIFRSAAAGYVVVGSDIGGYLDRDDVDLSEEIPFDTLNFHRWTAVGALTPFMQLHGRANITPWEVPGDTDANVAIYRYWATLHHQLVPFFYSLAEEAYAGGPNLLRPIGEEADWPGDYRFMVGDAFLVAPILDGTGRRDVVLPAGEWTDWWDPSQTPISGPTTLTDYDATDPQHIPLFVREGAIVPLQDVGAAPGMGHASVPDELTVLVYPARQPTSFVLHQTDGSTVTISARRQDEWAEVSLSRVSRPTVVRLLGQRLELSPRPGSVTLSVPLGASSKRRLGR